MVKTSAPSAGDIITAKDLVVGTTKAASTVTVDPQVAALEKYVLLADKGITMLGQFSGIVEKAQGLLGERERPKQEEVPIIRETPPPDMPRITRGNEDTAPSVPPGVGAAEISNALGMILSQSPELTVAQLKELIDAQPGAIDNILAMYTKGGKP